MKQVVQYLASGKVETIEVPTPALQEGGVLVRTHYSVLSPGTERAASEFAQESLPEKALHRPDLVRKALRKAATEGVISTVRGIRDRMNTPVPLGYSSAGEVIKVGKRVDGLNAGDRVACAGSQFAYHADVAYIPQNLAVHVPDGVPLDHAAIAPLGAIALQGVRIGEVALGDRVAVIGLGLMGQLTAQIARAAGAKVLAVDLDPRRVEVARKLGADAVLRSEAEAAASRLSNGYGVDVVILTAATASDDPINLAATIAREKARVIVVGDVGMNVPREPFYRKELEMRLSRSYGPGRYDSAYEEEGVDYPYGYVRWTERRNMTAFIELIASGQVKMEPLITHRIPLNSAAEAYRLISGDSSEHSLGIVLTYQPETPVDTRVSLSHHAPAQKQEIGMGVVGAGAFARSVLLPAIKSLPGVTLQGVITASGLSAATVGKQFGFRYCASSIEELLGDESIQCITIATRHNLHAQQVVAALQAGKDVFVEKPLALNEEELKQVVRAHQLANRRLMVGFNRRFAPLAVKMREFLSERRRPLVATYRVNAGPVATDHWTQNPEIGGGRIIGEVCHFIDLLQFLVDASPQSVYARSVKQAGAAKDTNDETILSVTFADGSVGTIVYAAGGDAAYPKERIEVFGDGRVAVLDDFRTLELAYRGRRELHRGRPAGDKGHSGEWQAFAKAIRSGAPSPIPLEETVATTLATFRAKDSLQSGQPEAVNLQEFLANALEGGHSTHSSVQT